MSTNNRASGPMTIRDVSIVNNSAANEHTRAAVEALAAAVKANAEAIAEIARALKGAPASMEYGIKVGD
jgi:hypothetical protein